MQGQEINRAMWRLFIQRSPVIPQDCVGLREGKEKHNNIDQIHTVYGVPKWVGLGILKRVGLAGEGRDGLSTGA